MRRRPLFCDNSRKGQRSLVTERLSGPSGGFAQANQLIQECSAKTAHEMAALEGQWVAWSKDGRRVLAQADDLDALFREIDAKGVTDYVIDSIPPTDEGFLGVATS